MRLLCNKINYILDMQETKVPVYLIENKKLFLEMVLDLKKQIEEKQEGSFSLFDGLEELNMSKECLLISDVFHLNFKNKKILSSLLKSVQRVHVEEEHYEKRLQLESSLLAFVQGLLETLPYPLEMDDTVDWEGLFKLFHIRFEETYDSYLEKIIDYVTLCHQLGMMRMVFFVNLKTILTQEECERLYQDLCYREIPVILLENREECSILEREQRIIIDEDLCELY